MIEVLSPQVANMIAAGEVVERPASALKELLENAVDAGASAVTAEVQRGGTGLIRVTDNGEGMTPDDAARAFMRHATSKLRTAGDLAAIGTLGFRGEALAAIAAVSRVDLLTRRRGAAAGTALTLEAGAVVSHGEAGCPEGTTVAVRDLFFNTPARQKFLKKDSTEAAAAQEAAVRMALSRPGLSVRFLRDGSQALHTPGDGDLKNCLYSVFGRAFTAGLLPLPPGSGDVKVGGFVGAPGSARSARAMQYFIVAGRPIRSRLLSAALEEAFSGALMTGRYPVCCLHIELPLEHFDVNVHPAKSEVKFSNERAVFDAVYQSVKEALREAGRENAAPPLRIVSPPSGPIPSSADTAGAWAAPAAPSSSDFAASAGRNAPRPVLPAGFSTARPTAHTTEPAPLPPPEPPAVPAWRLIGEAMAGYLLVETPETLWIIDKHAAHERVLYNRLKAGERPFLSQQLITPRVVALSGPELDILLENRAFLEENGFEMDVMGPGALAVRAAPGDIDESEIPSLLSETASLLRDKRRPDLKDEALRLLACKAAVKLGRSSRLEDMRHLAGLVMETPDLRHCPHGRPVAVRLTKSELGRQFGR